MGTRTIITRSRNHMNNTFNPEVDWQEVLGELMRNGKKEYFPSVSSVKPQPVIVLIKGIDNDTKLAFSGQTMNISNYFRSSNIVSKIKKIENACGECKVFIATEQDVTNDNQPLATRFFNHEHVRKAIAEKTNVEHLIDGYVIV